MNHIRIYRVIARQRAAGQVRETGLILGVGMGLLLLALLFAAPPA